MRTKQRQPQVKSIPCHTRLDKTSLLTGKGSQHQNIFAQSTLNHFTVDEFNFTKKNNISGQQLIKETNRQKLTRNTFGSIVVTVSCCDWCSSSSECVVVVVTV